MAGIECFAVEQIGKQMVTRYHSNILTCTNLFGDDEVQRRYREQEMSMSARVGDLRCECVA